MLEVLEMSDSAEDLGPWLDRALMSTALVTVVDDLMAIHNAHDESLTAENAREWLGEDVASVLESGMGVLGNARLRQLLVRPSLLLAIQELVLVEGGAYWNALMPPSKPRGTIEAAQKPTPRWLFMVAPLAIAASIAAFVAVDMQRQPALQQNKDESDLAITRGSDSTPQKTVRSAQEPWGWNRDELLNVEVGPAALPVRLADALSDWFRVTASDGNDLDALRLHLGEMWAGCQQVLSQRLGNTPPEIQQEIRDCVLLLEERVQATLRTLHQPPADEPAAETAARAKKQADAWVQETVETLRKI